MTQMAFWIVASVEPLTAPGRSDAASPVEIGKQSNTSIFALSSLAIVTIQDTICVPGRRREPQRTLMKHAADSAAGRRWRFGSWRAWSRSPHLADLTRPRRSRLGGSPTRRSLPWAAWRAWSRSPHLADLVRPRRSRLENSPTRRSRPEQLGDRHDPRHHLRPSALSAASLSASIRG